MVLCFHFLCLYVWQIGLFYRITRHPFGKGRVAGAEMVSWLRAFQSLIVRGKKALALYSFLVKMSWSCWSWDLRRRGGASCRLHVTLTVPCLIFLSIQSLATLRRAFSVGQPRSWSIEVTLLVLPKRLETNRAALRCILSISLMPDSVCGSQITEAYSSTGLSRVLYALALMDFDLTLTLRLRKPSSLFPRLATSEM